VHGEYRSNEMWTAADVAVECGHVDTAKALLQLMEAVAQD
jgi:hypothetical protein